MTDLNKALVHSCKLPGVVAIVTAALNLVWVVVYWGNIFQSTRNSIEQGGTGGLVEHSLLRMHLMIEAALIIAAIGLLFCRITGIVISAMALIFVGIEYIGWAIWTRRTIEAAGLTTIPEFIPRRKSVWCHRVESGLNNYRGSSLLVGTESADGSTDRLDKKPHGSSSFQAVTIAFSEENTNLRRFAQESHC